MKEKVTKQIQRILPIYLTTKKQPLKDVHENS